MFIGNPIYDTVFKHLMENNRVARFFVETLIDQPVENIVVSPQEKPSKKRTKRLMKRIEHLMKRTN